jgi:hypothetical protein
VTFLFDFTPSTGRWSFTRCAFGLNLNPFFKSGSNLVIQNCRFAEQSIPLSSTTDCHSGILRLDVFTTPLKFSQRIVKTLASDGRADIDVHCNIDLFPIKSNPMSMNSLLLNFTDIAAMN